MTRDPKRIRAFLGRFYSWYETTYKATHPRIDNAGFWIVGAMLSRFDAILGAGVGRSLNTKGLAEELAFQMLDSAAKSGVRMDWPTFSRSWRGLAVKCGIKAETIAASYAKKPKANRGGEGRAVEAGQSSVPSNRRNQPQVGGAQATVPAVRGLANFKAANPDGKADGNESGTSASRKVETPHSLPPSSALVKPSTELDFAVSTWLLYRRNKKWKSDAELFEFHRTKCAALKAEKVGAA